MNTLPAKWYIQVTPENYDEVKAWWLKQVEKSGWHGRYLSINCIVLSVHPYDDSYYWIGEESCLNDRYPSYKKIILEQFRQITNPKNMTALPTNWYIEVTEENRDELDRWRQQVATEWRDYPLKAGHTLLSRHQYDGSYFYSDNAREVRDHEDYADYQEITLEQFRQITNPKNMTALPTNWYIEVTEENQEELNRWRQQVATSHSKYTLKAGHTLLSRHHRDGSYFYCDNASVVRDHKGYADYQEITLEQFRQITNSTPKPMTKSIQISRDLLNEYYDAATTPQREYLAKHFRLDGTTTDEAIRGLYDLACRTWKPRIKKNHPECFENEMYFDFSAMAGKDIVEPKVAQALGLSEDFIEVRDGSNPKLRNRSFYLSTDYNWELVNDNAEGRTPVMVLIPTKK